MDEQNEVQIGKHSLKLNFNPERQNGGFNDDENPVREN